MTRPNASFALLLVCFFLSGLAGLIYQTAWTREFAFVFGTSNLAVATVLSAYMAGLAAGAGIAAQVAHRIQRPLLSYGVLELGVGLAALAVPFAIHGSQALYVALLGGQSDLGGEGGLFTALFYLVCSFLILMVPTAMMGATLPLLVRHSVHSDEEISGRIGLLYSINTAGAVVGTVTAAFWLLPELGLRQTIWVAAAVNGLVFLAAWGLARTTGGRFPPAPESTQATTDRLPHTLWILPLIFGSGLVSFTYEVLWVRLLEHLLGGSVYAFSTMLASFLMGIALGAAVAARIGNTRSRASLGFAVAQLGIAALSLGAFLAVDSIPALTNALHQQGYSKLLIDWTASTLTLFPAATLIGATFPFAVRILARDQLEAGAASARVYAINTLGSVVGAIGAGFFVIPALGYAGTLAACVAINLVLALATTWAFAPRSARALQIVASAGLIVLLVLPPANPWKILRYSSLSKITNESDDLEYLGVGRAATVLLLEGPAHWFLRTNGNPEGRISPPGVRHNTANVARWLGALPSLARPEAESLLVVGFGGGVALETVPSLIDTIDVIELEPQVVEANRRVSDRRWRDPLQDPRLRLHLDDARNVLTLTDRRFDAIVSQPSHPWSAGASHLYTQEFFELVQDHLSEDGVFVQWIGLAFVDELLFRTLLATLASVYQNVQVYNPAGNYGVLFLASDAPIEISKSAPRALAAARKDFNHVGVYHAEDMFVSLLLDQSGVRALAQGAPINRDDHNIMQIRSPKILDQPLKGGIHALTAPHDPLEQMDLDEIDVYYLLHRLTLTRAQRLLQRIEDPLDQQVGRAIVQKNAGKVEKARQLLEEVLESRPRHAQARAQKLLLSAYRLGQGTEPADVIPLPLEAQEQLLVAGWRANANQDYGALERLDDRLAAFPRQHALSNAADSLRVEWRIASGDPERGREAVAISDHAVWNFRRLEGALLRARACLAAGDPLAAADSLAYLSRAFRKNKSIGQGFAKRAGRLLEQLPNDPKINRLRSLVERKLRALSQ